MTVPHLTFHQITSSLSHLHSKHACEQAREHAPIFSALFSQHQRASCTAETVRWGASCGPLLEAGGDDKTISFLRSCSLLTFLHGRLGCERARRKELWTAPHHRPAHTDGGGLSCRASTGYDRVGRVGILLEIVR